MHLYRIKNPRTIYSGMNACVSYTEDGVNETRWGSAYREERYSVEGDDGIDVRVEWAEEGYAPYHMVEDFTTEAESWVEVDLHDPVTALQILLRYREICGPGTMYYVEQAALLGLLHASPEALTERATALGALLARMDVATETKEDDDADPS